jgi:PAS domain S-box-containing protein
MNVMALVRGVLSGLIVLFSGVWAFGAKNIELVNDRGFIEISDEARILSDPSGVLSLHDILTDSVQRLFSVVRQSPINKGVTKSVFWIEFEVINKADISDWLLEIDFPNLNEIEVHILKNGIPDTLFLGGLDYANLNNLPNPQIHVFPCYFAHNEVYRVLIRIRTDSFFIVPISMMSLDRFIEKVQRESTYQNVTYGVLMALMLFNLILFLLTRDFNYLLMSVFMASLSLNAHYLYGFGFDILPNLGVLWEIRMKQLVFVISSVLFLMFTVSYLNVRRYVRIYRMFLVLIGLGVLFLIALFLPGISNRFFVILSPVLYGGGTVLILFAAIYTFVKKERMAIYYIIAFSIYTATAVFYTFVLFGKMPFNFYTFHINSLGTMLFGLLLTIGLVEKITAVKQERAKALHLAEMNRFLNAEIQERIKVEKDLRLKKDELSLLSKALEQSFNSVLITDLKGVIEFVNPRFLQLTGYSSNEMIGTDTSILSSGFHDQSFYNELWKTLLAGQIWQGEFYNKRKDGSCFWDSTTISPVFDDEGRMVKFLAIKEDITIRKAQEEALIQSERKLRELNATKDKFFSIVAHDLMNPFNALLGFVGLQKESIRKNDTEQSLQYSGVIEQSTRRIFELLQNLLLWSKSQSGRIVYTPAYVPIAELVMNTVNQLSSVARNRDIHFDLDFNESESVYLDFNMISTVLRNLISNAIKFSSTGDRIAVRVKRTEKGHLFEVVDNGVGIEPQLQPQLFDLERALGKGEHNGRVSTGLGLVLSAEFVQHHQGTIGVESTPGHGSRFWFEIPAKGQ